MQIDGSNINVAITLAFQNFINCFFKEGELASFSCLSIIDIQDNEIVVKGSFLAKFPEKNILGFGYKIFMVRDESGLWRMSQFMGISNGGFRNGKEIDLTLPTALERGHEFKKAMGF